MNASLYAEDAPLTITFLPFIQSIEFDSLFIR
jgi:hypothetical protein